MLESVSDYLDAIPIQDFAQGDTLLASNTRSGKLIFLETGTLAVVRDGVTITRIRQPGSVFGEMSLLLDVPHTADVVALTPVRCRIVENAAAVLMAQPPMLAYVAAIVAHRLNAATRYLVDVKSQFADSGTHLAMIDEVMETLLNRVPTTLAARAKG